MNPWSKVLRPLTKLSDSCTSLFFDLFIEIETNLKPSDDSLDRDETYVILAVFNPYPQIFIGRNTWRFLSTFTHRQDDSLNLRQQVDTIIHYVDIFSFFLREIAYTILIVWLILYIFYRTCLSNRYTHSVE